MSKEIIKVPDLGGAESVEVIEICVAVGDQVNAEDSLIVLESDKASMEVPSPMSGKVVAISISDGDSLSVGDVILELETEADGADNSSDDKKEAPAEADATLTDSPAVAAEPEQIASEESSEPKNNDTSSLIEAIHVPDIGGADSVDVIEVCISVGDEVAEGDSLIVLESEKSSMEVPAPKGGKVTSVAIKEGDTASEGTLILEMEIQGSSASSNTQAQESKPVIVNAESDKEPVSATASASVSTSTEIPTPSFASAKPATNDISPQSSASSSNSSIYAGPAVRRLAREMGVELESVKGSGPKGRISKDDIKGYVKNQLTNKPSANSGSGIPAIPEIDFSQFGEISLKKMSKIHKVTAFNMQRSWLNVPHVTQFDDADITDLEAFRKSLKAEAEARGIKITPMPFLLKACAAALKANPKFNVSLHTDGEHLVHKEYIHIGMAVDTPVGLMVPVIRNVDKKSIWELAAESAEIAQKAKDKKLKPIDMQGGCFTISSLGGIGGKGFTPIVNAPEVAILGVSKLAVQPVWNGEEFEPRKMLPLSLSYDHRAINGVDGGRFFTFLTAVLSDIRKLVL